MLIFNSLRLAVLFYHPFSFFDLKLIPTDSCKEWFCSLFLSRTLQFHKQFPRNPLSKIWSHGSVVRVDSFTEYTMQLTRMINELLLVYEPVNLSVTFLKHIKVFSVLQTIKCMSPRMISCRNSLFTLTSIMTLQQMRTIIKSIGFI